jgi:proteasome activator-like protein
MTQAMLEEARNAELDDAGRHRLSEIHKRAVDMVKESVSPALGNELAIYDLPFDGDPSETEIRIAHAQLIGWLNGLLMGVQAATIQRLQERQLGAPGAGAPGATPVPESNAYL